jgi:hypothetical protein
MKAKKRPILLGSQIKKPIVLDKKRTEINTSGTFFLKYGDGPDDFVKYDDGPKDFLAYK